MKQFKRIPPSRVNYTFAKISKNKWAFYKCGTLLSHLKTRSECIDWIEEFYDEDCLNDALFFPIEHMADASEYHHHA